MDNSLVLRLPLYLNNEQEVFFKWNSEIEKKIKKCKNLYSMCNDFNENRLYRNNMLKTVISDIDIENLSDTSVIDSVAAICCKKIRNKNQKTALNLLNLLESDILLYPFEWEYQNIIKLWSKLTEGKRNIEAFKNDYRKSDVYLKKGKFAVGRNVVYKAPKASKVHVMIKNLNTFIVDYTLTQDVFVNCILKAILFSAYFVYVHPFLDGNGRVSRLLMNKILIDGGLSKFKYISVNAEIVKDKSEYSNKLLEIEQQETGDFTNYIEYMLQIYKNLFERMLNPNRRKLDIATLSEREKIMLNIIRGSAAGIHTKLYKELWNSISSEQNKVKINIERANKDIEHLFLLDFLAVDRRYNLYPGFKYYNK